jgi:hypothetical protein
MMAAFLFILAIGAFLVGGVIFGASRGAVHEIEALVLLPDRGHPVRRRGLAGRRARAAAGHPVPDGEVSRPTAAAKVTGASGGPPAVKVSSKFYTTLGLTRYRSRSERSTDVGDLGARRL